MFSLELRCQQLINNIVALQTNVTRLATTRMERISIMDSIGDTPRVQNSRLIVLAGLACATLMWWKSNKTQQTKKLLNAVDVRDNEIESDVMESQNDPSTKLIREESAKLVVGVKFPVSRFNPPRLEGRQEGL